MPQVLIPEDNQEEDTELQKNIRALAQEVIDTDDDKEFTVQEVKNVVLSMGKNKAPGEDGIPSEVFKCVVEILPRYIHTYGDRGSTVVKVLYYKTEGSWFDPSWCTWNFSLT